MSLFIAWVLLPLLLLALTMGVGLLVEAAAGTELPVALLPVVGLAGIIVAGEFASLADTTAELITPAAVVLALAGWAQRPSPRRFGEPWMWATALAIFAFLAAPVVLSGQATFAGYIRLDDTATWMAMTDRVMEHGRSLEGLAPSSYEATLAFNLGAGYPIGAFLPLGVVHELLNQDVAWLIQPYMAFVGVVLGVGLWSLGGALVQSRPLRALAAVIASQAALLYGYYLWGGIKEIAAAALIAGATGLIALAAARDFRRRELIPLAVVVAAIVGVLSGAGIVWMAPALLAGLALAARRLGRSSALELLGWFGAVTLVLCLPALAPGLKPPTSSSLTSATALGNLIQPLNLPRLAGIWPAGDFRLDPTWPGLTGVLIVATVGAGAAGLVWAWRRSALDPTLYVAGSLLAALAIHAAGSPWVGAKALATASPAIPFAAALFGAALFGGGRRVAGGAVLAVIAGGVLWSNALAYRDVNLAPHDQLAELEAIGARIAGQGPALMTEYQPYGVRHFLRDAEPEGASELRRRQDLLVSGKTLPKRAYADTDRFDLPGLLAYRTLVLRRSPAQSRPPSVYRLTWRGDYYEIWQRPAGAPPDLSHLGLGAGAQPVGRPTCAAVRFFMPGNEGKVIAARRPADSVIPLPGASEVPRGGGALTVTARERRGGDYEVWLRGSVRSQADLYVDGHSVGTVRGQLENPGQYVRLGEVALDAGRHRVEVRFHGADLHPGSGGNPEPVGPLVLSRSDAADVKLVTVSGNKWNTLCRRRWDWIEVRR